MPVFKVTRKRVEEESFFVNADCEGIDEEHVITQGPKETEQLMCLLQMANASNDVFRGGTRTSWLVSIASDNELNRKVVGTLEFRKKYYAKVEFNVTHKVSRLVEVKASSRKEAASLLSERLDDDVPDIIESISEEFFDSENIEKSDCEVIGWGTNPDDLMSHYRNPVKKYSTED